MIFVDPSLLMRFKAYILSWFTRTISTAVWRLEKEYTTYLLNENVVIS